MCCAVAESRGPGWPSPAPAQPAPELAHRLLSLALLSAEAVPGIRSTGHT